MKKVPISLRAVLVLTFSSCNSIFPPPEDPIVGDWQLATWKGNAANSFDIFSRDTSVSMVQDNTLTGTYVFETR